MKLWVVITKLKVIISTCSLILHNLVVVLEKAFISVVTKVNQIDINLQIAFIIVIIVAFNFVKLTFLNYLLVVVIVANNAINPLEEC